VLARRCLSGCDSALQACAPRRQDGPHLADPHGSIWLEHAQPQQCRYQRNVLALHFDAHPRQEPTVTAASRLTLTKAGPTCDDGQPDLPGCFRYPYGRPSRHHGRHADHGLRRVQPVPGGIRQLSRKSDKTSSPARQAGQILDAMAGVDRHIIAWADDWEESGAT
jgi:hypothetical protein